MGVRRAISGILVVACLAATTSHAGVARAAGADKEEARAFHEKATGAFALGHYAQAAEDFEKAFELRPEPALLYNAAQAHRLAGNKERALTLYQNYLRVYAKAGKRTEIEARVEELKKAIEHDREVATSPPTTTLPLGPVVPLESPPAAPVPLVPILPLREAPPPSLPSSPSASSAPAPAPVLVARPPTDAARADDRAITRKPWFWISVGGGVAAAAVVVLLLAAGGAKDPSPSLGVLR
jgi:tetratricopeptide (TPR) repeat protein